MDMRIGLLGVLAFVGTSMATAHDALLSAALARPALPIAETRGLIESTQTVTGGSEPEVETTRVDPVKQPKKAFASYGVLHEVIGEDAHLVSERDGVSTYAFTTRRLPEGFTEAGNMSVGMDGKGSGEVFDGVATVRNDVTGKPFVSKLDLRLHKAAGNWIARVKRIDISYTYAPVADRDAIAANGLLVDVDVRAMFFVHRSVKAESVLVASETVPSPPPG